MNALQALRTGQGLTQQALADRAGINIRLIQKYESGEKPIENMKLATAAKLVEALGCDFRDLLQ